jgi:hypothetical protein
MEWNCNTASQISTQILPIPLLKIHGLIYCLWLSLGSCPDDVTLVTEDWHPITSAAAACFFTSWTRMRQPQWSVVITAAFSSTIQLQDSVQMWLNVLPALWHDIALTSDALADCKTLWLWGSGSIRPQSLPLGILAMVSSQHCWLLPSPNTDNCTEDLQFVL